MRGGARLRPDQTAPDRRAFAKISLTAARIELSKVSKSAPFESPSVAEGVDASASRLAARDAALDTAASSGRADVVELLFAGDIEKLEALGLVTRFNSVYTA